MFQFDLWFQRNPTRFFHDVKRFARPRGGACVAGYPWGRAPRTLQRKVCSVVATFLFLFTWEYSLKLVNPRVGASKPSKAKLRCIFWLFYSPSLTKASFWRESNKKASLSASFWWLWRRERDSNPRYTFGVYTLSRRAPSTTRTPLQTGAKVFHFFGVTKPSIAP